MDSHILDVSGLDYGQSIRVGDSIPLSMAMDLASLTEPVTADLEVRRTAAGFEIRGFATAQLDEKCHRCLKHLHDALEVRVEDLATADLDDGQPTVTDDRIDLLEIVRDAVGLAVPLRALCQPDCRGLCPVCGTDLNTDPCAGHDEAPQNPFAVLEHLLDPE